MIYYTVIKHPFLDDSCHPLLDDLLHCNQTSIFASLICQGLLVTVQLDHKVPEMVVLGQLSHRLVCTPDLETLFSGGSTKR